MWIKPLCCEADSHASERRREHLFLVAMLCSAVFPTLVVGSSVLVDWLYRGVLWASAWWYLVGKRVGAQWRLGSSAQEAEQAELGLLSSEARREGGFRLWVCAPLQSN